MKGALRVTPRAERLEPPAADREIAHERFRKNRPRRVAGAEKQDVEPRHDEPREGCGTGLYSGMRIRRT